MFLTTNLKDHLIIMIPQAILEALQFLLASFVNQFIFSIYYCTVTVAVTVVDK